MRIKYLFIFCLSLVLLMWGSSLTSAQTAVPSPTDYPTPSATVTPTLVSYPSPTTAPTVIPTNTVKLPDTPQGVSAVAINHERIDVSWKKVTNASAYEVYRNSELVAIMGSLLFSDNGLTPETTYSYKVRAFDGSNYSQFSTVVSATSKSEGESTPEPTIPADPDISERQPAVVDSFSFVMVGTVKHDLSSIPAFDAGENFEVNGKTENYADIEIVTQPNIKSFYAKADDKGFWNIKIDTSTFEAGMHSFQIIIKADNFPEEYESEEYSFEINQVEDSEEVVMEESSFGSKINKIVLVMLLGVVIVFAVIVVLAIKKGWFKKLFGKDKVGEVGTGDSVPTPPSSLEGMIGDIAMDTAEPLVESIKTQEVVSEQVAETLPTQNELQTQVSQSEILPPTTPVVEGTQNPEIASQGEQPLDTNNVYIEEVQDDTPSEAGSIEHIGSGSDKVGVEEGEGDEDFPVMDLSNSATVGNNQEGEVAPDHNALPVSPSDETSFGSIKIDGIADYSSITDVSPDNTPVKVVDSGAGEMVTGAKNIPDLSEKPEEAIPSTTSSEVLDTENTRSHYTDTPS